LGYFEFVNSINYLSKKIKMKTLFSSITGVLLLAGLTAWNTSDKKKVTEFYQLTVYHYTTPQQEQLLDNYLQEALLPALHRNNISKVGVFKAIANDTAALKTLYVLTPFKNIEAIAGLEDKLAADNEYNSNGAAFLNVSYNNPAFSRMETIILKSFSLGPKLSVPGLSASKNNRVYELRNYEGPSQKIYKNKVQMFNQGNEFDIFNRLHFNPVFYGEVVAGGKMPNLMYITSYESMEDRNAHWKAFGSDSAWVKLKSMPEYQNNLSHIDITFLRGVEYSDL
jgi:NIPSNAP